MKSSLRAEGEAIRGRPEPNVGGPWTASPRLALTRAVAGAKCRIALATVTVMTSEVALVRLIGSILEPWRRVRARGAPGAGEPMPKGAHVVVMDLDGVDSTTIGAARDAYPGAALIVLSAERRETDCIAALDMGADYLARPFSPADLAARVRVAELQLFAAKGLPRFYRNGAIAFDLFSARLSIEGRDVALARSERDLLAHLAERAGIVVPYERLLDEAGLAGLRRGRPALRSCVMRLRRKIEREPLRPEILLAEIGVGYRLAPPHMK